jgi:tetratricopeptide (TPR) repeat protein/predicted phosphodiesterase
MSEHKLRVLHVSDLHERVELDWMDDKRKNQIRSGAAGRYRVLGNNLKNALNTVLESGKVDLVCFSGDIADWGLPEEYKAANSRINMILETLGVPKERLFLIPGNHDVHRDDELEDVLKNLRYLTQNHTDATSRWIGGESVPYGAKEEWREQVLGRLNSFWEWVTNDLGRAELLPAKNNTHPHLGYRVTKTDLGFPFPIHIIGMDSAWLCGDDNETGKLALTKTQIDRLTTKTDGSPLDGFRLAMVHHPLNDLSDVLEAQTLISSRVDVLLRGHQHEATSETLNNPDQSLLVLAAGSLYEGDKGDRYINGFQVIDVTLNDLGQPLEYDIWFWGWSTRGFWHLDNSIYENAANGRANVKTKLYMPPDAPITPVTHNRFVGRETELEQLRHVLLPASGHRGLVVVCSVQGMAGVGKSWLVEEFYRLNTTSFGRLLPLVLEANPSRALTVNDLLGRLADQIRGVTVAEVPELLRNLKALVHLENVDNEHLAGIASDLARKLQGVAFVVTGRYSAFADTPQWKTLPLRLFTEPESLKQLDLELKTEAKVRTPDMERRELVKALNGLPLALHLAASQINKGFSIPEFLQRLKNRVGNLSLPVNDIDYANRTQRTLEAVFDGVLESLEQELKNLGVSIASVYRLGLSPRAGFGLGLGSVLSGLDTQAKKVFITATELSVIEQIPLEERSDIAWRIHPLLAQHMSNKITGDLKSQTSKIFANWVLKRLKEGVSERKLWDELKQELHGLSEWISSLSAEEVHEIVIFGREFALANGPYQVWLTAAEFGLNQATDPEQRSQLLWTRGNLALHAGEYSVAMTCSKEMQKLAQEHQKEDFYIAAQGLQAHTCDAIGDLDSALKIRQGFMLPYYNRIGNNRELALIHSEIANAYHTRGQHGKALAIRQDIALPIFREFGTERDIALAQGKVADSYQALEQLDLALKIRQNDVLPTMERLRDIRSVALTQGKIADIYQSQGKICQTQGDKINAQVKLDQALAIRQNLELPAYKNLNDIPSEAATQAKIAHIFDSLGNLEEAIRIFRENVLPVQTRLGHKRDLLITQFGLAEMLISRCLPGDIFEIDSLLRSAVQAAREMKIPEAEQIENCMRDIGLQP